MNKGCSSKTILKYLLYVYAYVQKWKKKKTKDNEEIIKNRWGITFTSDKTLLSEFKMTNCYYALDRLQEIGVLYKSNEDYLPSSVLEDNIGGYTQKYDIVLAYFEMLSDYLHLYNDLPIDIQNNYYLSNIKNRLEVKAEFKKKLEEDNLFKEDRKRGKPKVNYSTTDYLIKEDYIEIVNDIQKSMFTIEVPKEDITILVADDSYDYPSLWFGSKEEKEKYPNIVDILYRLRTDKRARYQKKTTFSKKCIGHTLVYDKKLGRTVNRKICQDVTKEELAYLKKVYTAVVIYHNYVRELAKRIETVRQYYDMIVCKMHIEVDNKRTKIEFKNSTRQYNDYASIYEHNIMEVKHRTTLFALEGYDCFYDLHSTVFVIAKLLNQGIWYKNPQFEDDLKLDILSRKTIYKEDGTKFEKEDLKKLSYRMFFQTTKKGSIQSYIRAVSLDKLAESQGRTQVYEIDSETKEKIWRDFIPHISVSDYEYLYDTIFELCGDLTQYVGTIFYFESILECMIIEESFRRGKPIRNTYDCFYYSSKDYTKEEFIELVDEVANAFYVLCLNNHLSLWWDDIDKEPAMMPKKKKSKSSK